MEVAVSIFGLAHSGAACPDAGRRRGDTLRGQSDQFTFRFDGIAKTTER
jgi:hypothetical protein